MRRAYEAMSFLRRRGGAQDLSITRGRTIQDFILKDTWLHYWAFYSKLKYLILRGRFGEG